MSNAFAEKLAPMMNAAAPDGITVEALDNWEGVVFVNHRDGYRGLTNLTPDNRRKPDHGHVVAAFEQATEAARRMSRSQVYTDKARAEARAAYAALERDWRA